MIPILTSAKTFVVKVETKINAAINSFFIIFLYLLTIYKNQIKSHLKEDSTSNLSYLLGYF
jgi:hypothetical protein